MAEVTGYTADFVEDNMIVEGEVVGDDLILRTPSGVEFNAGDVRGAQGYGTAEIHNLPEVGSTPEVDDEIVLYDQSSFMNKKSMFSRLYDFIKSRLAASINKDEIIKVSGTMVPINPNKIILSYIGADLSSVSVRNNGDTADITTTSITYAGGNVSTVTTVSGGTTVVYTMNYSGNNIASITKTVT